MTATASPPPPETSTSSSLGNLSNVISLVLKSLITLYSKSWWTNQTTLMESQSHARLGSSITSFGCWRMLA
ncbi:hypothetical protein ACSBR1_027170 [Camellia fascicularis]